MFTQGTVGHSVWRTVVAALSFGLPLLATTFPTWEQVSIGTVVFWFLHYAQSKMGI